MKDLIHKIKKSRIGLEFESFLSSLDITDNGLDKYYNYKEKINGNTVNCLLLIIYESEKQCHIYVSDICLYYNGTGITSKHMIEIIKEYYELGNYSIRRT